MRPTAVAATLRPRSILMMRSPWVLAAALGVVALPARAEEGWERVSDKDGVVVDRRVVAGSSLKEFRGRGTIDANPAAVLGVFSDIGRGVEWMDSCAEAGLVEDRGPREKVVYNRTGAPWPVSDRDAVLDNKVTFDAALGAIRIDFAALDHPAKPPVKGVVRMGVIHGHWYLWPSRDGRSTRAEYQVFASPGGRLPDWMANYASKEIPRKTILALRAQARRRGYPEFEKQVRALPEYQAVEARARALPEGW